MILLAFLLPFSIYLFVLGSVNRRRHPVMASGVADFAGVLFASSGFLLLGGPFVLSSLSERWRQFWLLGRSPADDFWQFSAWVYLAAAYFVIIVGGAALVFRSQRHLTSVYNADQPLVRRCLIQVCEQMGLDPVRSGNLFVFGVEPVVPIEVVEETAFQTAPVPAPVPPAATALLGQPAVLELDAFARMRHVTLRWDPPESALRRAVEAELAKVLAETNVEPSDVGVWLTMIGATLFAFTVISGVTLLAIRAFL